MKKILLPVSFSNSSRNSLRHAHALDHEAKLTLLNCFPVQKFSRQYDFGNKDYELGIRELLIQFYHQHIEQPAKKPTFLVRSGAASDIVAQISGQYDLMVMSRKDHPTKTSGYFSEKKLFIIAKAKCPVLIMPTTDVTFSLRNCDHIWHIKRRETEPEVVVKGMAKLGINAERMEVKSFEQKTFLSAFWKNLMAYESTHDKKLLKAIEKTHDTEPIDLIVLVDHEQSVFVNFLKSDVIRIFCEYDIPILVFPAQ